MKLFFKKCIVYALMTTLGLSTWFGSGILNIQSAKASGPGLTSLGFTSSLDGGGRSDLAKVAENTYVLITDRNASSDYNIQFSDATGTSSVLKTDSPFALKLTSSTVAASELETYYANRGVPEPYLSYLNGAANGLNAFAYIDGNGLDLRDGAKYNLPPAGDGLGMSIPGNYPIGRYVLQGNIEDVDSISSLVTLTLIIEGPDATLPVAPVYNSPETSTVYYGSNPVLDIDFSDNNKINSIDYKIGSTGIYRNIASDVYNPTYTTDWSISDQDWTNIADGSTAYIYFQITDYSGNKYTTASNTAGFTFKKDITKPVTTLFSSSPSYSNNLVSSYVVNISETPLTGSVLTSGEIVVSNGTVENFVKGSNTSYSFDVRAMAEGEVAVKLSASAILDRASNQNNQSNEVKIKYDSTAPIITVDSLLTLSATPTISGTLDDSQSTINVNVSGVDYTGVYQGGNVWSANITNALTDGIYDVVATATDLANNSSVDYLSTNELEVDLTAPQSNSVLIDGGAAYTRDATVDLSIGSDSAVSMSFDGGSSWESYATSKTIDLTSGDGAKTVEINFKDLVGNISVPASSSIILDGTAPTVFGVANNKTYATNKTITYTDTNGATAKLYKDGSPFDDNFASGTVVSLALLEQAYYSLVVTDSATNTTTVNFIIDRVPPAAELTNTPATITQSRSANIIVGGTDVTHYKYSIDNGLTYSAKTAVANPIVLSDLADGSYKIFVKGMDAVGNTQSSPITEYSWTIDNAGPVLTIIGENPMTVEYGSKYVDSGATTTEVDATITTTGADLIDTGLVSTEQYVTYSVTDSVGNTTELVRTVIVKATERQFQLGEDNEMTNPLVNEIIVSVGGTKPATVNFEANVPNPVMNLSGLLETGLTTNSVTLTQSITASVTTAGVKVTAEFPKGITITGDSAWDGTIKLPSIISSDNITKMIAAGLIGENVAEIEIGFPDVTLTFDKEHPVKITMPGQAGKTVGYIKNNVLYSISDTCSSIDNPTLGEGKDCKINSADGKDMIIWTMHFTKFVTYTETAVVAPVYSTTISNQTLSVDWKGNKSSQYRVIVTGSTNYNDTINADSANDINFVYTKNYVLTPGSYTVIVKAIKDGKESVNTATQTIVIGEPVVAATVEATTPVVYYPAPATVKAAAPAVTATPVPSDEDGKVKAVEEEASTDEDTTNWTPWIVLFILLMLAGAATAGYFRWFNQPEVVVKGKKSGKRVVATKAKAPQKIVKSDKKIKRW